MSLAVMRPLEFGEVLDQAFGLYRRQFAALLAISAIANAIPTLLIIASAAQGGVLGAPGLWGAGMLLGMVGSAIATGASTYLVAAALLGRELTVGEALARAWPKVGPLIVASFLFTLVAGLATIALIIPGIIAVCGLILSFTALTVEDLGPTESLGRSWELMKGGKGRMFGLLFVFMVVLYVAIFGVTLVGIFLIPMLAGEGNAGLAMAFGAALTSLAQVVLYPLAYCILVTEYYDRRVRKEGFDLELLATTMERPAAP